LPKTWHAYVLKQGKDIRKVKTPKKCTGCPGEDGFCKIEIKYNLQNSVKTKIVCFGKEIAGTKVTNLKTALVSRPSEDVFCWKLMID
jgi:hypothetical protein